MVDHRAFNSYGHCHLIVGINYFFGLLPVPSDLSPAPGSGVLGVVLGKVLGETDGGDGLSLGSGIVFIGPIFSLTYTQLFLP